MASSAQDGLHVLPAMQHPHDGDRPRGWVVNNQTGKHRPEFHRQCRQILTKMSYIGTRGQQAESHRDFLQYVPSKASAALACEALACEIVPDFLQVFFSFRG
jgi:hypothetical protein